MSFIKLLTGGKTNLILEKRTIGDREVFNFLGNIDKGFFYRKGKKSEVYCVSSYIDRYPEIHWVGIIKLKSGKRIRWPHTFDGTTGFFTALYYSEHGAK